ncbi:hypothetical protein HGB13_02655 [bacterium]|nr:hypothetical protein [bacterium]
MLKRLFNNKILKTAVGVGSFAAALFLFVLIDAKPADARYYTRAEWGCPEANYSTDWAPQYDYADHVVIHHTAAEGNPADYAGSVRAIWSYHTYTKGWGDIGYNYLIDPNGNVYEGRYGGDDVIGAHASTYNRGSIGISIIGDYSNRDISVQARDSLLTLIADKLGSKGIEPNSSAYFASRWSSTGTPAPDDWGRYGVAGPRVDGHRLFDQTACPGNIFYNTLGNIRIWASQRAVAYTKPWSIVGSAVYDTNLSAPIDYTNMYIGQTATAVLIIRNNTNYTWVNSGPNAILLGTKTPQDNSSPIANNWIAPWRATSMFEASVAPGQNATFHYGVKAPSSLGSWKTYLAPVIEGVTWLNHSGYNIPLTVTQSAPAQPATGFKGELVSSNLPSGMVTETVYNAEIKIKNTGGITWSNTGTRPVLLGTIPAGTISPFGDSSWLNTDMATILVEPSVATGQIGTFRFKLKAPIVPGTYNESFGIVRNGAAGTEQDPGWAALNISKSIKVKGTLKTEIQSYPTSEYVLQGTEKSITLSFKNTGTATWLKANTNLGTSSPYDRISALATNTWLNGSRPAALTQNTVAPGETGTFTFNIRTTVNGVYNESFSPVVEGEAWLPSIATINITVAPPTYNYQFVSQAASKNLVGVTMGEEIQLTLSLKNIGNINWTNTGANPMLLGTSNPRDRASAFYSPVWLNAGRPTKLKQTTVAPGEIGTFEWTIKVPRVNGEYREFYTPVVEGKQWLQDAGFNFYIYANSTANYQFISQSASKNLNGLIPGEEVTLGLVVKNTGTLTWTKSGQTTVNLGTSNPNDRVSPFYNASWINNARPTTFNEVEVRPGENATFEWVVTAPNSPNASYREHYNVVMEGISWMPAVNFNYYIYVAGNSIDVTSTASYDLNLIDGQHITTFAGNTNTAVYYQNNLYTLRNGAYIYQTNVAPKFSPSNGIMKLSKFVSSGYSSTDNVFRGNMEVRYSANSNKLYAINEVYVEDYLKGLGEASASGHPEHLKVMTVAARTYATYHLINNDKFPNEPFHCDATTSCQVYRGYGIESRFPQLATAVLATSSQIVTSANQPIVAAYSHGGYVTSDNNTLRTRSGPEAGWSDKSYWRPVADPYGDPNWACGTNGNHCVGLSATGSQGYASAGFLYNQILTYYYTGTAISNTSATNIIRVAIYSI